MKSSPIFKTFWIVFVLLGLTSAATAQIPAASRISRVTLFSNQALITRTAEVSVEKGINEILLGLDAFQVDSDSVSARVFGKGELYSVQMKKMYFKDTPQTQIRKLESRLEELRATQTSFENEKKVLANQERFLNALIDFSKTQIPQEIVTAYPKTEDLNNTLVFLENGYTRIHVKRRELDQKIRPIEKEIKAIEKELADLNRPRHKSKNVIEIMFKAAEKQQIRVETGYLVPNAFWQPLYKAVVPVDTGPVALTLFSKILQKTGEDWNDIELSVSNIVPLKGASLPKPHRWIVDIVRPSPKRYRSKQMRVEEAQAVRAPAAGDKAEKPAAMIALEQPAAFATAQRKQLPLSFEYQLPGRLKIASRDKHTLLPLLTKKLKGEYVYHAVPRITPVAFLVCRTTADKEILGGLMNVHFGAHFVGKTVLQEKKAGDTFDLNLGIDREIKISRLKVRDKIRETLFGKFERKTVVRDMAYKLVVENLKDKPVAMNLFDTIPVSRTDKIKVEDIRLKPEPSVRDYNDKEGVMLWSFKTAPGAKKEVEISFTISYPKDEPVRGL